MSGSLQVLVDPESFSMRESIRACFASTARVVALTERAMGNLVQEVGDVTTAMAFLVGLCGEFAKPCAVNMANPDGTSQSVVLSPPGWSAERLTGYVGGVHEPIEAVFGPISRLETPPRGEPAQDETL
jgi:hypothetical protein